MILFNYLCDFELENENILTDWVQFTIDQEQHELGEINYIFCDDDYLTDINIKHLNHNTLTDIISFDYTVGTVISGDIYISVDRVRENAKKLEVNFRDEMHRVMVHGVLHFLGFADKTDTEKSTMRSKEDYYLSLRTF